MTDPSIADAAQSRSAADIWQTACGAARGVAQQWMTPTEGGSYMGGLEERPILAASHGNTFTDTDGNTYLDFPSDLMKAALGHQHPRMVSQITDTMQTIQHSYKPWRERSRSLATYAAVASCSASSGITDRHTREPADEQAWQVTEYCQPKGLTFQIPGVWGRRNVRRLVPSMTTTDAEIDHGMTILHDALRVASANATRKAAV